MEPIIPRALPLALGLYPLLPPEPQLPLTASQMASRCRASSFWAISLCRCRYQPSKWGDLKNRLWVVRGSRCGLTP